MYVYYAQGYSGHGMAITGIAGLAIAGFYSYRKPRDYQDLPVEGAAEQIEVKPLNIIIGLLKNNALFREIIKDLIREILDEREVHKSEKGEEA